VKEKRYAHSSCFIEAEKLIVLLHDLAARIGTASGEHGYGDKQAVRLENGWKALDYTEADERFSAASFKGSMEKQGIAVRQDELIPLIDNMRSLSKERKNGGVRSENMGIVVPYRCSLKPAGEFALSDFYVTRIADRPSNNKGWSISQLGSKIDRREESERRSTWHLDTLQSRMTLRVVKELHTLGGTYR
jgi:hypothetical protein